MAYAPCDATLSRTEPASANLLQSRTSRFKILVADSDKGQLDQFSRHLDPGRWSLATAASGLECIGALRRFEPHVMVLEPEMPWGSGSGILEYMREDPSVPRVPVIVLTRGRDRDELRRVLNFTPEDLLFKPVSIAALERRIRVILAVGREEQR